ncbi:hypothetical protein ACEWPM_005945 [Roseovarius sp. S4756]|uniref:hypothetical protein n=1 Tax=Roseovarius maritimus TaxID=3342637 RepID=UPI00372C6431
MKTLGFGTLPVRLAYANDLFSLNFPDEFEGPEALRIRTFGKQIGQLNAPITEGDRL